MDSKEIPLTVLQADMGVYFLRESFLGFEREAKGQGPPILGFPDLEINPLVAINCSRSQIPNKMQRISKKRLLVRVGLGSV